MSRVPRLVATAAIVERDGAFLVTRRPAGAHLEGCWEFPGGKCEANESHGACLRREMIEELDVDVAVGGLVFHVEHAYPDRVVALYFYRCTLRGVPRPRLGQEMRWASRADLGALEFPPADAALIERLRGIRSPPA